MSKTMHNQLQEYPSIVFSAYDDEGVCPDSLSPQQRRDNVELVIDRFFVGKNNWQQYDYEALVRNINPCPEFASLLKEEQEQAEGGFGPDLLPPSSRVEAAFREYAHTELGCVVLARLIAWDDHFIDKGWRDQYGMLTEAGVVAYGEGYWRPFRVASSGDGADAVTQSGALLLPDLLHEEYYSTGDISNPLAIIHHEIKAHVLPLKEAVGLVPGREMELICVRLESEMLQELGLPVRHLNWGMDDGTINHTLHEASEQYFHGLVQYDGTGRLVEVDPGSEQVIGPARVKT